MSAKVSVCDVLDDGAALDALQGALRRWADHDAAICLSVSNLGADGEAVAAWQAFCEKVRASGARPGFCVHSHLLPLESFCAVADSILGGGPRFVYLDSLQMLPHSNRGVEARTNANWRILWRGRAADHSVVPVYGGFVRSACPLLSDEVADSVQPVSGIHAPRHSAWLPIELPLAAFSDRRGRLDEELVLGNLRLAMPLADRLFDQLQWAGAKQAADAHLNRRVAFMLTGLGDVVLRQGKDPGDLGCLNDMSAVVGRIRARLGRLSGELAVERGAVPALQQACPAANWFDGPHADSWSRHFEEARTSLAIRHRNLLVMSPYSVLPQGSGGGPEFADLLPLIGQADAWSFSGAPGFESWNTAQFKLFHRRARAIIQASHSGSRIAARV